MNRKQGPRMAGMRLPVNAPQGDSDPLWAKVHAGSYAASHRRGGEIIGTEINEVTA